MSGEKKIVEYPIYGETSTLSNPPVGFTKLYPTTSGWHSLDSNGSEIPMGMFVGSGSVKAGTTIGITDTLDFANGLLYLDNDIDSVSVFGDFTIDGDQLVEGDFTLDGNLLSPPSHFKWIDGITTKIDISLATGVNNGIVGTNENDLYIGVSQSGGGSGSGSGSGGTKNIVLGLLGDDNFAVFKSDGNRFHDAYTFPTTGGTSGQTMVTDGNGNLSFATLDGDGGTVSDMGFPVIGLSASNYLVSKGGEVNGIESIALGKGAKSINEKTTAIGSEALSDRYGENTFSVGKFDTKGDLRHSVFLLFSKGSSDEFSPAPPTLTHRLFLDNPTPFVGTENLTIPNNTVFLFNIRFTSIVFQTTIGTPVGATYSSQIQGCIKNIGGTTSLVGTTATLNTFSDVDVANISVSITADNTTNSLNISATSTTGADFKYLASVDLTQISY